MIQVVEFNDPVCRILQTDNLQTGPNSLIVVAAISPTDVSVTTEVAEQILTCVLGKDTSLVVESCAILEIPLRRSAHVRKPNSIINYYFFK